MQYLFSVIHDNPDLATTTEMADIKAFNQQLKADGHWVFAGGLAAPSTATVIDNRGDEAMVTDGPFVESKEFAMSIPPLLVTAAAGGQPGQTGRHLTELLLARGVPVRAFVLASTSAPSTCAPRAPR